MHKPKPSLSDRLREATPSVPRVVTVGIHRRAYAERKPASLYRQRVCTVAHLLAESLDAPNAELAEAIRRGAQRLYFDANDALGDASAHVTDTEHRALLRFERRTLPREARGLLHAPRALRDKGRAAQRVSMRR